MRAILFMLIGFVCYATSDMVGKLLTQSMNPLQITWARQLGLFTGIVILLALRGPQLLRSRHPVLQIGRGLTVVAAGASFMGALAYVPLADATVVTFVAPFIVMVLAAIFLGEKMGPKRWVAVLFGFAGTLIVIRPGMNNFHPAIFLALISAAAFAIRQIISRHISGGDPLVTTVAYTTLTATIVLTLPLPFIWQSPASIAPLLMMVAVACLAGCAELSIIHALDLGEAAVLSPLQYTLIIWSTIWGFLVFGQVPDIWTLAGTAVIIASGIYSLYHETRKPGVEDTAG